MYAIVLAGGFGKRLKNTIGVDIPKPMATINERPFLDYLFDYLFEQNIKNVVLSVFYKHEIIKNYYGSNYKEINIFYSVDSEILGTGGAIKNALLMVNDEKNIYVINGDTYFDVDLKILFNEHVKSENDITFSLKQMKNFDRYGIVETDSSGLVLSLQDKQYRENGNIDGGIYLINKNVFNILENQIQFSFNDFISNNIDNFKMGSVLFDELFIDIGTPEDYEKAQKVLRNRIW